MLEVRPDDRQDFLHKNFFRYRAQIEQDFQRALSTLEQNQLLATPSDQEENPKIGSISQNDAQTATAPPPPPGPTLTSPHPAPISARSHSLDRSD